MENFQSPFILLALISLFCLVNLATPVPHGNESKHKASTEWPNHGGDIYNRRFAACETKISPATASKLKLKWEFNAGRDVTATPAISDDGVVYFPSWNGYIYAVKQADGCLVWKQNLQQLTGLHRTFPIRNLTNSVIVSRSTPTIADDKLMVSIYGPAYVVALRRETGELVWSRQLDFHPGARVTMSGTYFNRAYYIGVSTVESASSENCCTFRGSFVKLDIQTGAILWQTYMVPDNNGTTGGYAGGNIWGSSPSIDAQRNHVYIATGNLNSVPHCVEQCQERQNNQTVPTHPEECIGSDVHSDSVVALDLDSGEIKWYRHLGGYDVWFLVCVSSSTPNCPPGPNPNPDFSGAPMLLSVDVNGIKRDIVVAVQTNGYVWALDRSNGSLVWFTEAGPGSIGRGGRWGAATDTRRVYINIFNSDGQNCTLSPSNNVTNGGGWVAMDAKMGQILWSTAVPNEASSNPVTIANGVLFSGSTYGTGPVYAIDAENGEILWSYEMGASIYGGMSVSKGCVYVGSGYAVNTGAGEYTGGTSVFSFCIN